jgi:small multidrug resistance pump
MGNLAALVASGICSAIASILLRIAGTHNVIPLPMRGLAIASYGAGFALYAVALKKIPLVIAYPSMVSVSIVVVTVFSVLAEQSVTGGQLAGVAVILTGVWLLTWK